MARDRARDDRRSVGSHEKMMRALGRAAGWESVSSEYDPQPKNINVIRKIGSNNDEATAYPNVRVAGEL